MKKVLNYFGQIRLYSLIDVFVFATALSRNTQYIFGVVLLWLSFLLYLEAQHKDRLRLRVKNIAWVITYIPTLFLLPIQIAIAFGVLGVIYAMKKKVKFIGLTSPIWRGAQNFVIAFFLNPTLAAVAFVLVAFRNLMGDFRDVRDDREDNMKTIPIILGFTKNQHWAFYGHLIFVLVTTYTWLQDSFLDKAWLIPILVLQVLVYPITPRSSNPAYLSIYKS